MKKALSFLIVSILVLTSSAFTFALSPQDTYVTVNEKVLSEIASDLGLVNDLENSFSVQYNQSRMMYEITITKTVNTTIYEPKLKVDTKVSANDTTGGWEFVSVLSHNSYKVAGSFITGDWAETGFNYSIGTNRKSVNCTLKGTWAATVGIDHVPINKYSTSYNYTLNTSDL